MPSNDQEPEQEQEPFPGFHWSGRHRSKITADGKRTIGERYETFRSRFASRHEAWTREHGYDFFLASVDQPLNITSKICYGDDALISGPVGGGKTAMLESLQYAYTMDGVGTEVLKGRDLEEQLKIEHRFDNLTNHTAFLGIDDLTSMTPKTAALMLELMDRRSRRQCSTVLTSNLVRAELITTLDERTYDRFDGPRIVLPKSKTRRHDNWHRPEGHNLDFDPVWDLANADGETNRRNKLIGALFDFGIYEVLAFDNVEPEHERTALRIALRLFPELEVDQLDAVEIIGKDAVDAFAATASDRLARIAIERDAYNAREADERARITTEAAEEQQRQRERDERNRQAAERRRVQLEETRRQQVADSDRRAKGKPEFWDRWPMQTPEQKRDETIRAILAVMKETEPNATDVERLLKADQVARTMDTMEATEEEERRRIEDEEEEERRRRIEEDD